MADDSYLSKADKFLRKWTGGDYYDRSVNRAKDKFAKAAPKTAKAVQKTADMLAMGASNSPGPLGVVRISKGAKAAEKLKALAPTRRSLNMTTKVTRKPPGSWEDVRLPSKPSPKKASNPDLSYPGSASSANRHHGMYGEARRALARDDLKKPDFLGRKAYEKIDKAIDDAAYVVTGKRGGTARAETSSIIGGAVGATTEAARTGKEIYDEYRERRSRKTANKNYPTPAKGKVEKLRKTKKNG